MEIIYTAESVSTRYEDGWVLNGVGYTEVYECATANMKDPLQAVKPWKPNSSLTSM
jgi:hypothetical protein